MSCTREYLLRPATMAVSIPTGIKLFNWLATV